MHPLVQQALELILTNAINIVAVVVSYKVYEWLGLQADDKRRAYLETALQNGLRLAIDKLVEVGEEGEEGEWEELSKAVLSVALDYTKQNVPNALRKLKITDAQLLSILEARLPMMLDAVAAEIKRY